MVGERIRLARTAARMSLRALAQQVGVSHEVIRKYEQGKLTPSSEKLLKIAHALNKPVDFFRPPAVHVGVVQPVYRGHVRRTRGDEAALEAHIRDWLERYLTIEQILEERTEFWYPAGFPRKVHTLEEVEQAALDLRRVWELGLAPIANLTETLEKHGIRVGEIPGGDGFDACAFFAYNDEAQPVIIYADDAPGDRQRFSLAHELGHIMLLSEGAEETFANRFAGAFLVPAPVARRELSEAVLSLPLLHALKHRYGLSMQAWIRRARDLQLISHTEYQRWNKRFRTSNWHRQEPGEPVPREHPTRFQHLVFEAYDRELITASRASQLLGVSLQEFLRQYALLQGGEPIRALGGGQ